MPEPAEIRKGFHQEKYIPIQSKQELKAKIRRFLDAARTTHTFIKIEGHKYSEDIILSFCVKFDFFDEPFIQKEDKELHNPGLINLTDAYYDRIDKLVMKYFNQHIHWNNTQSIFALSVNELIEGEGDDF